MHRIAISDPTNIADNSAASTDFHGRPDINCLDVHHQLHRLTRIGCGGCIGFRVIASTLNDIWSGFVAKAIVIILTILIGQEAYAANANDLKEISEWCHDRMFDIGGLVLVEQCITEQEQAYRRMVALMFENTDSSMYLKIIGGCIDRTRETGGYVLVEHCIQEELRAYESIYGEELLQP